MIAGLQKMTLLDYPGKVACTVFLQGCNFRCPFCHNSGLLDMTGEEFMTPEDLIGFLRKRKGLLDGVCITGGEPTLQPGLMDLARQIKEEGFLLKLDTNGSRPKVLKQLIDEGLVDYVAMDIKNSPDRYGETVDVPKISLECIQESIRLLLQGKVAYEFRTTVMDELHDEEEMQAIGAWLQQLDGDTQPARFFLQPYADRDSVLAPGMHTPSKEKLLKMAQILAPYAKKVEIRALD